MAFDGYREVFLHSSSGFAVHRVLREQNGALVDFEAVEANPAFEKLVGRPANQFIGQKWSALFRGEGESKEWFFQVKEALQNGERKKFRAFPQTLGSWFSVEVIPLNQEFFLTSIRDISGEVLLRHSSESFLQQSLGEIGFEKILDQARQITGARFALFQTYNEQEACSTTVAVSGDESELERATVLFGAPLQGLQWPANEVFLETFGVQSGPFYLPVESLAIFSLPPVFIHSLKTEFHVESAAFFDVVKGDRLLGNFTFLLDDSRNLKNVQLMTFFARQVGLLLSREEAEKELLEKEKLWKFALEGSREGVWDWDVERGELFFSPQWKRLHGFSEAQAPLSMEEWESIIHPEDREKFHALLSLHLSGETDFFEVEHRVLSRNGGYLWFLSRGKVMEGTENGSAARMIGTSTKIPGKKIAEISVRQSEEEYRKLAEDMPVLVCKFLADGTLTYVNGLLSALTPYSKEQLVGMNFFSFLQPEDRPGILKNLQSSTPANPIHVNVQRIILENGEERWQEWTNRAFFDEKGKTLYFQATGNDVTRRREMEQEVRRAKEQAECANRAKTQFLMNMSHELRTPLNGIMGFSQLLTEMPLTDEQKEFLEYIRMASGTLKGVIGDILDFSRIESGKEELVLGPGDLYEICNRAVQMVQWEAQRKGIGLEVDFAEKLPREVVCDSLRLQQVLTNLLGNAVKFTAEGQVRLEVRTVDGDGSGKTDRILFRVEDTGIGIHQSFLERIFQPFEQEDTSSTRRFGGTGLGLSICRKLLELMDSTLHLESSPGKGSVFSFEIDFPRA